MTSQPPSNYLLTELTLLSPVLETHLLPQPLPEQEAAWLLSIWNYSKPVTALFFLWPWLLASQKSLPSLHSSGSGKSLQAPPTLPLFHITALPCWNHVCLWNPTLLLAPAEADFPACPQGNPGWGKSFMQTLRPWPWPGLASSLPKPEAQLPTWPSPLQENKDLLISGLGACPGGWHDS